MIKRIKLSDLSLKTQAAIKQEIALKKHIASSRKSFKAKTFRTKANLDESTVNTKIEKHIKEAIRDNLENVEENLSEDGLNFATIGYSKHAIKNQTELFRDLLHPYNKKTIFDVLKRMDINIIDVKYEFVIYGGVLGSDFEEGGNQHESNQAYITLKLSRPLTEKEQKEFKTFLAGVPDIMLDDPMGRETMSLSWENDSPSSLKCILTISGVSWSDPQERDEDYGSDDEEDED